MAPVRCFIVALTVALLLTLNAVCVFAQPPGVQKGDPIEYLDPRGQVKKGQFVEMVGSMVRIRIEDGSTRVYPGNRVRLPQGKPAGENRPGALAPANNQNDQPMPAATPPAGSPPAAAPPANAAGQAGGKTRTWTDATGKYKIEAEFISLVNDQVQLKKADGKFITLGIDKLSAVDQEVAKALAATMAAEAPANKKPENPFEVNVSDKPAIPAPGQPASSLPELTKTSLQGGSTISLAAPGKWAASVDPSAVPPPAIGNRLPTIPPRSEQDSFWERAEGMLADPAHHWLWVAVKYDHGKTKFTRLERIDLQSGTVLSPITIPTVSNFRAIDPTGKYLLMVREDDFSLRGKQLDLWELEGDQLKPVRSFIPYDKGEGNYHFTQPVSWAAFVDDHHAYTASDDGMVVLWNLKTFKPEFLMELGNRGCALSPGRKHLAVGTNNGVYLLDALRGDVLGKCEMPEEGAANLIIRQLAFSSNGEQLAAVGPWNVWVWNVADGKNKASFSGMALPTSGDKGLSFGSHNHLVLDHRFAFDIERGLMTCHITGGGSAVTYAGREWYLTEERISAGKSRGMMHFVLPGDEVVRKAQNVDEKQLLAIKPGSKISLELNLPFDAAEVEKIRESMAASFRKNGWDVAAPGTPADFTLTASTSVGETKSVTYRTFGRGIGSETVSVTYHNAEMVLRAPGEENPIWQAKTTWGPPFHVNLKEGQTLADALQTSPKPQFFMNPGIPRRLMKYPNGISIVNATLSPQGITIRQ
jgi:hypothetical protein